MRGAEDQTNWMERAVGGVRAMIREDQMLRRTRRLAACSEGESGREGGRTGRAVRGRRSKSLPERATLRGRVAGERGRVIEKKKIQ